MLSGSVVAFRVCSSIPHHSLPLPPHHSCACPITCACLITPPACPITPSRLPHHSFPPAPSLPPPALRFCCLPLPLPSPFHYSAACPITPAPAPSLPHLPHHTSPPHHFYRPFITHIAFPIAPFPYQFTLDACPTIYDLPITSTTSPSHLKYIHSNMYSCLLYNTYINSPCITIMYVFPSPPPGHVVDTMHIVLYSLTAVRSPNAHTSYLRRSPYYSCLS